MEVQKTERPLAAGIGGVLSGTLTVVSALPLEEHQATKEGVFSFVLYYHKKDVDFTKSLYYRGIYSYLQCVKRGGRFSNWSVVVYTDKASVDILITTFPFEEYPMLVICVVDWPAFTDSKGLPNPEMLRTVRFQCVELFPRQICCIRDADTIFQGILGNCYAGLDQLTEFSVALEAWEQTFVDTWITTPLIQKPIVIGSDLDYRKIWHSNFPAPVPWRVEVDPTTHTRNNDTIRILSPFGMYAGFVNFSADKSTFQDLWTLCVQYLGERYTMVRGSFVNGYQRIISNKHSQAVVSGGIVGKDEKLLLFVIARLYFADCFFFPIQYNSENYAPGGRGYPPGGYIQTPNSKPNNDSNIRPTYYEIPRIKVCGGSSGLLNPEFIVFMIRDARDSKKTITTPNPLLIRDEMAEFYKKYESWKSRIDIPTFLTKMKNLEKTQYSMLKNPRSYGFYSIGTNYENFYNQKLNSPKKLQTLFETIPQANINRFAASEDLDEMFLQQVGLYNPEEEAEFQRQINAERQIIIDAQKEREKERLVRRAEERAREFARDPYRFRGGVHRKTRKHRRFTKKTRKIVTRKCS